MVSRPDPGPAGPRARPSRTPERPGASRSCPGDVYTEPICSREWVGAEAAPEALGEDPGRFPRHQRPAPLPDPPRGTRLILGLRWKPKLRCLFFGISWSSEVGSLPPRKRGIFLGPLPEVSHGSYSAHDCQPGFHQSRAAKGCGAWRAECQPLLPGSFRGGGSLLLNLQKMPPPKLSGQYTQMLENLPLTLSNVALIFTVGNFAMWLHNVFSYLFSVDL